MAHLGILELLLDIMHQPIAHFTDETSIEQFWSNLTGSRHRSTDANQPANLIHAEFSDPRNERKVVERDVELSRLQVGGVGGGGSGIDLEIFRLELGNEVVQSATEVREEAVVMHLDGIRKDLVRKEDVAEVDVEGGQAELPHRVDLVDVDEFTIHCIWCHAIRSWGGCEGD